MGQKELVLFTCEEDLEFELSRLFPEVDRKEDFEAELW